MYSLAEYSLSEERARAQGPTMDRIIPAKMFGFLALILALGLSNPVLAVDIAIVSGTNWTVTDSAMLTVGNAQAVCLSPTLPANCPVGATIYNYPFQFWTADLSHLPGAVWIWAPNILGTTPTAANTSFTFETQFYLCGTPKDATIAVGADDQAEVFINGSPTSVFTWTKSDVLGVTTVPASAFVQGLNIIQVKVTNFADPSDCKTHQFSCNPAGFVFGGLFGDALSQWPTCSDAGKTFHVGDFETFACPTGQFGAEVRACICISQNGVWSPTMNECVTPTCSDNGKTYNVGDKEPVSCPPGDTGTATRSCTVSGWGATDSSACKIPTCIGNGTTYNVGDKEPVSCPPGEVGSATRTCTASGVWGATDSSACKIPTCSDNGKTYNVGDKEPMSCPSGESGSATRTCTANGWGGTDSSACKTVVTCVDNGKTFNVGETEGQACPTGQVGTASRTCSANGTWSATDTSRCTLPEACSGCLCGSVQANQTASCPSGTSCQHRAQPKAPRQWYCVIFGIDCPVQLWTTDWFCDP